MARNRHSGRFLPPAPLLHEHRGVVREAGLERYDQALRESDMDADVLRDLTDAPKEVSIPLRPPEKL